MQDPKLPETAGEQLDQAANALGISLDTRQAEQLLGHMAMLAKWGKVYNLTAIRDPAVMLRQHLIDSLSVVPSLLRHLNARNINGGKVLDVGSGGGFPGLTIATVLPQVDVTCVDSVGKKVGFMRQVIAEMGLSNARAEHSRIEELPPASADVITSRAFASLQDFTRLTQSHLAPGGAWMAMKARRPEEEISMLDADIALFHVEQLSPPGVDGERCLVWMRPRSS